ncbi:MAG: SGNH/GDSL hydrolase family protein [Brevundimonas sp.]|uniref:autotransporter domain-containing protein n=1 Tax=Brevundimonas sp. TaxID=1871086 RepID=UPI0027355E64|nr:autotransporter domain-containing protein [Brevundimonas sp.]MBX9616457.1 autotransporter domain-containing protein [Caulobacteraceae bacterium]MDP3403145.1 SGNH/GDSL hydrolase family protein [Brevundimonas sp.]
MSRYLRGAALAALTLAASAALATTASAQSYGRLVVFGDSLSDNGNLYLASGRTQPPSPPYFQGRFSNGPAFTELLGFTAANFNGPVTGSINYAYGGSRTDNVVAFPPGMRQQLTTYTSAGGVFGSRDLVSVLGGANNIFQALPTAGVSANPTGAITPVLNAAVADMAFIVDNIASRGAGTVLVTNLPRLGITPQFRTSPVSPLADFAGSTFNSGLQTALLATAAARPGTNIILFDVAKISNVLAGDPGRFGLSNVTEPCFTGVSVCSNPDSYLYFDGVHPTAAGHRLFAALANDYLYYGDRGAGSTLQGETAYRHREDALDASSARLSGRETWTAGTSISVEGLYDSSETDARGPVASAQSDGYGARMMLESGTETMRFGLAGSYRNAEVEAGPLGFELQTLAVDVYGGWRSDSLFLNVAAGAASDDYNDIDRISGLAPLVQTGSTRGFSAGARAQGGLWFDMGGIALSPRVAVTWASSDVDGYVEQGAAASYEYRDRSVTGVTGEVALRAEGEMGGFGVFVEGGYRESLDDSSDAVRVGIQGNPARVLSRAFDDPFGGSVLASAGIRGDLGPIEVEIGYRGRFGDHADSHLGGVTLTLPL